MLFQNDSKDSGVGRGGAMTTSLTPTIKTYVPPSPKGKRETKIMGKKNPLHSLSFHCFIQVGYHFSVIRILL